MYAGRNLHRVWLLLFLVSGLSFKGVAIVVVVSS